MTDPTGMSADPPLKGMDTPNGTVHTDSDGTWVFNQKTNTWVGQNGAPDFSNSIGLPELIINSPGKPKSAMDGYFHPAYDTSKPNPYSPSTDWRYSVAIAGVVALPVLIEAYGVGTLLEFAVEEVAEEGFEQATGIPVIVNPVDIVENGIKKSAIKTIANTIENAPRTISSISGHAINQAITRGFKSQDILKIVKDGTATLGKSKFGNPQWRYMLNGNTVIIDATTNRVITIFSNAPGTKNKLGAGFIKTF